MPLVSHAVLRVDYTHAADPAARAIVTAAVGSTCTARTGRPPLRFPGRASRRSARRLRRGNAQPPPSPSFANLADASATRIGDHQPDPYCGPYPRA